MIGQTISHYRITRELGSGGMGIVFEAEDLKLNRHVALKLMLREAVSEEHRKRFIREAQAASALNHPNITTIYDFLELDSGDVIVMEYVAGVTLREKIANGPLSIEQVVRIGIEACNALAEAHAKGIVHRDIKPENLMLSDKEKLKITDFGCVKLLDLATAEKTQEGALLGTLCYMSPEQLQGEVVDGRSDLFSLGAVLYELLTGCFPFRGEYSTAIAYSIVHENPSPLHELRPEIPPALENLIFKALAKDVQERYQTAFEMEADLRSIQSSVLEIPKLRKIQFSSPLLKRVTMTLVSLLVIALTVSLVFLLGPSKDGCHGITSIAVMPFELSEVEENWNWLGKGIADLLNTELTHGSTMRVLSAQQRMTIMQKLGIRDAYMSKDQALQVARKAKARNVVMGSLRTKGNIIRVKALVLNTDTGTLLADLKPIEGELSKFYELVHNLSSRVKEVLNIDFSTKKLTRNVTSQKIATLDAYRNYIEGLDAALDMRHQESIEKLNRAIDLDSTFIKAYYYLAWQYRIIGDLVKAKLVLAKGRPYISHLSEEARLRYLSNEANIEHRWKEYAAYLERLLRINPFDAKAQYGYGWTQYHKFRKLDAGIAAMKKALQLDSTYSQAYNTLGFAYLAKGEPEKALEMIDKFAVMNPADVNPLDSKAMIQVFIGQYNQAIFNCERILAIQPDFQYAALHKAWAYLEQGRISHAMDLNAQNMKKVTNPYIKSNSETLQAQGYFKKGEFDKALLMVEQAIASDSTNLEAHWLRGWIMLQMGDKNAVANEQAAIDRTLASQEVLEGMWYLYHLRGEIAMRDQDFDSAIELFMKALELGPLNRAFYLTVLANAYLQSGQFLKAVKHYQEALYFNPNYAPAAFRLGQAYEHLKKRTDAYRAYRRVLEIWSEADEGIAELEMAKKKLSNR